MKNLPFIFLLILTVSCNQQKEKTAEDFLQSAQRLQQSGSFTDAKLQIDSIHILFPKDVQTRRMAQRLLLEIELVEFVQSLEFLQNEWAKNNAVVDSLSSRFVLQKDEKYQTEGSFVHKSQASENTLMRTMLKAFVAENGQASFSCTVVGQSPCAFDAVRISAGDVFVETAPIAEDGAFNRTFNDGLHHWRTIMFRNENDAIALIAQNTDKNVKISALGRCRTSFDMPRADRLAFKDAYFFSMALSEITRLKSEISKAERMVERLQERLR